MQTETIEIPIEVLDKNTKSTIDGVNKSLGETSTVGKKASFSFTEISSAIGLAKQAYQALKQVYDLGEMGAQNQRLMDSGRELAASYGSSMDNIIAKVKEASFGTVSELDIVSSANRAMMLNVTSDADQMGKLMQVAAFRARSMGISTTQAFNDIVTGIGRNSPLILDNLGIITKGWAEEAKAAGVAYDQQFILNKVLEQGAQMMDEAGGFALDAAGEFEKFEAANKDLFDEMKRGLAEAVTPLIKGINDSRDAGAKYADTLDKVAETQGMTTEELKRAARMAGESRDHYQNLIDEYQRAEQYGAAWAKVLGEEINPEQAGAAETAEDMTKQYEEYLDLIGDLSNEEESYHEKMRGLTTSYAETNEKLNKLKNTRWWDVEAIDEQQKKMDELRVKMQEEADDFEENTRRRTLSMLEERLAADGLTEAETRYLEDLGVKWGVYSITAIESARATREEVEALVTDFNNLPTEKTMLIKLQSSGIGAEGLYAAAGAAASGAYKNIGKASGTNGWETVPAGYPNDTYPIGLTSGEKFAVIPASKSHGYASGTSDMGGSVAISDASLDKMMNRFETIVQRLVN